MTIWNESRITSIYYDDRVASQYPCVVRITGSEILVEYESGTVQYVGKDASNGHFELTAKGFAGRATLHMFPNSKKLEGSWVEGTDMGMWKIDLE